MSKICFLNGSPGNKGFALDSYLRDLTGLLDLQGHEVTNLLLRDMDIKHCTGCWGCWVKTPGECVIKDDSPVVCRAVIQSDLALFASPVIMGFTSATLKRATDRLIPLVYPYFDLSHGEFHHLARYDRYPRFGLLLEKTEGTDNEDIEIISDIFTRMALDIKSALSFMRLTSCPPEEVADEIGRI
ncbi:MAG TPA: NAD(P)H-dependent oxidoreductase [archaeon]|nr:NAD(P)H-dependent oxidoreductase [archaeon]